MDLRIALNLESISTVGWAAIANAGKLPFPTYWDFSLTDWSQLPTTGAVFTADEVEFVSTDLSYIKYDTTITLSGDFFIEFIDRIIIGGNYILGLDSDSNSYINVTNGTKIQIRIGGVTYTFSGLPSLGLNLIKVVLKGTTLSIFVNDVFAQSQTVVPVDFIVNATNLRAGGFQSDFAIRYLNINNQHEYLFTEGVGEQVRDRMGSNHGTFMTNNADPLLIPTWTLGVDTQFNLLEKSETLGWNTYDVYNGVDSKVDGASLLNVTDFVFSGSFVPDAVQNDFAFLFSLGGIDLRFLVHSVGFGGKCVMVYNGTVLETEVLTNQLYTFVLKLVGNLFSITLNGVLYSITVTPISISGAYTIGGNDVGGADNFYSGVIVNLNDGTNDFNTWNNWGGGTISGTFGSISVNESKEGSGVDEYNYPIQDPTQTVTINPLMTQTSLMSHSNYDWFDGGYITVPSNTSSYLEVKLLMPLLSSPTNMGVCGIGTGTGTGENLLLQPTVNRTFRHIVGGTNYDFSDTSYLDGKFHTVRYESDGVDGVLLIDGVQVQAYAGMARVCNIDTIGISNNLAYPGLIISFDYNGTIYTSFNDWDNGTKTGAFSKYVSPQLESAYVNLQNLVLWSENFQGGSWNPQGVAVVGQVVSRLTAGGATDGIAPTTPISVVTGNVYVASVKIKPITTFPNSTSWIIMGLGDNALISIAWATLTASIEQGKVLDLQFTPIDNGFYQLDFTYIASDSTDDFAISIDLQAANKTSLEITDYQLREYAAFDYYLKTEATAIDIQQTIVPANPTNTLLQGIDRMVLKDGLNLTGQEFHHVNTAPMVPNNDKWTGTGVAGILTRNDALGDTDYYAVKVMTNDADYVFVADDIYVSVEAVNGLLTNTYGGTSLPSTATPTLGNWLFVCNTVASGGTRTIYIGTDVLPPVADVSDTVVVPQVATQPLIIGNDAAFASDSANSYLTGHAHYTNGHVIDDVIKVWKAIKTKMK